jgi:alkylation response protein AidB-like acyl-CoA dehydrogenase
MSQARLGPEVFDHGRLAITPEERELVVTARGLADERFAPRAAAYDRDNRFPAENFDDLRRSGLMALRVPRAYGGHGASELAYAAVVLEIAKGDPATALCFTMHCTAMGFLEDLGDEGQRARLYGPVVRDGAKFSALGSEPRANIFAGKLPSTVLAPAEGGYLLRGTKAWCSLGGNADYMYVNATLDGAVRGAVVPRGARGVVVRDDWDTMAMRGTQSASVAFEDVFVPAGDVVARPMTLLHEFEFMVGLCASYLGVAEAAFRHSREMAREAIARVVSSEVGHGHPDAGRLFTAVGEMKMALEPAWLMVQRAAQTGPVGTFERASALAAAKYVVGETAARVCAQALRTAGARALERSCPVQRLFRDAQAGLVMAIKPDNAAYLAGRFELGVLPDGLRVDAGAGGFAIAPENLPGGAGGPGPGRGAP